MIEIKAEFPPKLRFLFDSWRYKVARGGRGSAKSWSFARALLIKGTNRKLRVLCAREVQLSIKQSVHKLLKDQISILGLDGFYTVNETEIKGRNGTEFAFTGLSQLTVDTIKSFEGYDICWVEEGQAISKRSWEILIPTIRKEHSEIWISYNPDLETDETHHRFTTNKPVNCCNVEMNWRDNPWFNKVLDDERLYCKEHYPDDYDNIWEGKTRAAVEGAIYFKQLQEAKSQNRVCNVPYDPMLKVHIVVDLGWADAMSIGMIQKNVSEVRVIDYIEDSHKTLANYSHELKQRKYNWGKVYLPHDGFAKGVKTGKSSADIMQALGWDIVQKEQIVQLSVEEGIKQTRLMFPQLYIDKTKCERLIECLKRYRRHINRQTQEATIPFHDEYSHGADMLRYTCINSNTMTNESNQPVYTHKPPVIRPMGRRAGVGLR
jgi:phage terminase large subunit